MYLSFVSFSKCEVLSKKVFFREDIKVGPVNNILGSLFKSVDMYLNGVRVSEVSDVYSYVSVSEIELVGTYTTFTPPSFRWYTICACHKKQKNHT